MFIPKWLLLTGLALVLALVAWAVLAVSGRNPLPFPDPGSRIFTAASPEAKDALVELLAQHGLRERLRADSGGVLRSILYDGTIINHSPPEITAKLGGVTSAIGLVSEDPAAAAEAAATFLRERGFKATVVPEIEPGLPIVFVQTDALPGSAINFRPHILRMPRPEAAP